MYSVFLERSAERDLRSLPADQFERIVRRIGALASDPRPAGCCRIVGSENDWRIRVGAYRVIYAVDDAERSVMVMRVRPRRTAYR